MPCHLQPIPPDIPKPHPAYPPGWGPPGLPPPPINLLPLVQYQPPVQYRPQVPIRSWPTFDPNCSRRPPLALPQPPPPIPPSPVPKPPLPVPSRDTPTPVSKQGSDVALCDELPLSGYRHFQHPSSDSDSDDTIRPVLDSMSRSSRHSLRPPSHISHEESEAPSSRSQFSNYSKSHDCPQRGYSYVEEAREPERMDHRHDPSFNERLSNGWQHVHVERRVRFSPSTKGGSLESWEDEYARGRDSHRHHPRDRHTHRDRDRDLTPRAAPERPEYYREYRRPRSEVADTTAATAGSSNPARGRDRDFDDDEHQYRSSRQRPVDMDTTAATAGSAASTRYRDRGSDYYSHHSFPSRHRSADMDTTAATAGSSTFARDRDRDRDRDTDSYSHRSTSSRQQTADVNTTAATAGSSHPSRTSVADTTAATAGSSHPSHHHENDDPPPQPRSRRTYTTEEIRYTRRPSPIRYADEPTMSGALPNSPPPQTHTPPSHSLPTYPPLPPQRPPLPPTYHHAPRRYSHLHTPRCTHPSDIAAASTRHMATPEELVREEAEQRAERGGGPPLGADGRRVLCSKHRLCGENVASTAWFDRVRGWRVYCWGCWERKVAWHGRWWVDVGVGRGVEEGG